MGGCYDKIWSGWFVGFSKKINQHRQSRRYFVMCVISLEVFVLVVKILVVFECNHMRQWVLCENLINRLSEVKIKYIEITNMQVLPEKTNFTYLPFAELASSLAWYCWLYIILHVIYSKKANRFEVSWGKWKKLQEIKLGNVTRYC